MTCYRELSGALSQKLEEQSEHPPRGWNSYDSYSWIISESDFLENAEIVSKRLLPYGYKYVVVDFLWYRKLEDGASVDSLGFDVIDEWGRVIPDPGRWPSSSGGKGFSEVAKKVHDMGLNFGIHVMRGISTQAINANTPILDTIKGGPYNEPAGHPWYAKDIGVPERACAWMTNGFMGVDNTAAGRAFLRSLYQQYADWGVDFVKHDCVFGADLDLDEISIVSEVLKELDRPILYSISPGTSVTVQMARDVSSLVNMYRITGDDWDKWGDVEAHFDISSELVAAKMLGASGLQGKSWPDSDMLPLGWLTDPGSNQGPHRNSNLTPDEQRTQMTLWSMTRSPLMFGGDMKNLDETTYDLITNPILLEINSFSTNTTESPYVTGVKILKSGKRVPKWQSRNSKNESALDTPVLSLISCKDQTAKGWAVEAIEEDLERICWKENFGRKHKPPVCFYKKNPRLTSDDEVIYKQQYEGKFYLSTTDKIDFCLDASPNRKLTSQDQLKSSSLSRCRWNLNQMWELNLNGTLVSSYSGLCAAMKNVKGVILDGNFRSWIAIGRQGEIYLSIFNLTPDRMELSSNLPSLANLLPGRDTSKCRASEVFTGKDYGVATVVSIEVETHGAALFILNCT
ncbi:hypothetical protein NE237_020423 [Protea cynaroides]|uniref:Alpha-galactosidase n=1 Tax=Protea cynaroides TaxID=273540 RepID=A0A9Q0K3V6_9MAGN|nr:hypothetical protein NE237_020423 [Protea cynaroides]